MTAALDAEQLSDLKTAFSLFDHDGDGEITAAELGSVMESLGLKPSKTELGDIMNEIDVDQSGTISFDEFATIMAQKVKASDSDAELRAAFEVFDKDGSGTINAQELFQVMKSIGEDFTEAQIDEMLKEADHDGNGTIDFVVHDSSTGRALVLERISLCLCPKSRRGSWNFEANLDAAKYLYYNPKSCVYVNPKCLGYRASEVLRFPSTSDSTDAVVSLTQKSRPGSMAGGREERLMMRQRGAGRQVKEFGFDLVLPGQSISPLKQRKSGRSRKTPQPDLPPPNLPRRTPEQAPVSNSVHAKGKREAELNTVEDCEGDQDILGSDPSAGHGEAVDSRKRKLEETVDREQPLTKKKRKTTQKLRKEDTAITRKGRHRKPKSASTESDEPLGPMEACPPGEKATNAEVLPATGSIDEAKGQKPGPDVTRKLRNETSMPSKPIRLPKQPHKPKEKKGQKLTKQKRGEETELAGAEVDQGSLRRNEPSTQAVAPAIAPVKKRKKRKSVGQLFTQRPKRPSVGSPDKSSSSGRKDTTSDLVNELLESTIVSSPRKRTKDSEQVPKLAKTSRVRPKRNAEHVAAKIPDVVPEDQASTNEVKTALEQATETSVPIIETKARKKRRSITQQRKPRIKVATDVKIQEADSKRPKAEAQSIATAPPISKTIEPEPRQRQPLSNITNSISGLTLVQTEPEGTGILNEVAAPAKRRGRPRKGSTLQNADTSESRDSIVKPAAKPRITKSLPKKLVTGPTKVTKAPIRPRKILKHPTPITVINSTKALPDDPDADSDDPLSGPSNVKYKKPIKYHMDELAQDVPETLEKEANDPGMIPKAAKGNKASTQKGKAIPKRGEELTPQKKGVDDEKRKAIEQEEIEELLGSIGKAFKRGREMAAKGA
ncbi:hypothetical protein G7Y79_00018g044310 [Physcia stellaris]|nr:hypothetical protein G7Y79_00018g044310 [Physcia stellaris]